MTKTKEGKRKKTFRAGFFLTDFGKGRKRGKKLKSPWPDSFLLFT